MRKQISLNIENKEVLFAAFIDSENLEMILFCRNGYVYHYEIDKEPQLISSSVSLNHHNLDFYSHGQYICLAERYNRNGYVLNLSDKDYLKKLERGDYQVGHCAFPIAFYENNNQTFLIHGTDWNRLDITILETDELLTDRIVDDEKEINSFDYFHSSLLISPDSKHFTSNGWVWSPYDIITAYSIKEFLQEFELSHTSIDFDDVDGYNWDRPLCWIDNQTIGIGYNKKEANDGKGDFPSEIVFVDILENKIVNRIEFEGFGFSEVGAVIGELFFDPDTKQFIGLNKQTGLLISDIKGKEFYTDTNLTSHKYSQNHKFFYRVDYEKQFLEISEMNYA